MRKTWWFWYRKFWYPLKSMYKPFLLAQLHPFFFMLRNYIIMVIIFPVEHNYRRGLIQAFVMFSMQTFFFAYIVFVLPLTSAIDNIILVISDFVFFAHLAVCFYYDRITETKIYEWKFPRAAHKHFIGYEEVFATIGLAFFCIFLLFLQSFIHIYFFIRRKCCPPAEEEIMNEEKAVEYEEEKIIHKRVM